jgi:hypothetical protein
MSFPRGARVVLLRPIRTKGGAVVEPSGARGYVKRCTQTGAIVTFDHNGRTVSVPLGKLGKLLGNDHSSER